MDGIETLPYAVYLKREADKVIAHQKYKRCLAMANVCAEKLYRQNLTIYGYKFYCKWLRRWLTLAAKFKPNPTINKKEEYK